MANKIKKIEKTILTSKSFAYTNEEINLNFTLNTDNSSQLRKFKKLLQVAVEDIDSLLEGMDN